KPATAQYTYTFIGWDNEVVEVTGNATYTAEFSSTVNEYTVTWLNWDGTTLEIDENVPYGTTPSYDAATPTKAADAQYTYTFNAWSPAIVAVEGDVTYTAQYIETVNEYTVTWLNWDGSELAKQTVKYGETPAYIGTPSKPATAEYTYTFNAWSPAVVAVEGDATYTAQYTETVNEYTVTWLNWDGSELAKQTVKYGETPAYTGTPSRVATAEYTYTFNAWSPAVVAVEGDATYTAQYNEIPNIYTITFNTNGGSEIASITQEYGTAIESVESPTRKGYTFGGWDVEIPTTMPAEDITITAIWNVIDYTISYDFVDGYIDIDSIIEDFLNDYNTARGKSHTVESFYALGSWGEISDASLFLYNSTYKAKWAWLVNYIAEVAGSANKVAFETFFNYSSQAELNAANSNNIYRIAYELRGWVGQAKYTQNGNFHSADYSDSEVQNKLVNYYFAQTYNIESDTITIPELIKNGCQFIGWIDENGNQVASIQSGSTGNISLSAVYTYNFTLNTNDGTLPESYYEYVPTGDLVKSMTLSKYDNTGNASGIYFCDTSVTSMNSLRWQYKILLQADENGWYKVVAVDAATASVNSVATNAGVEWTHALASSETNISTYASVGNYLYLPSVSVGDSDISANIYDEMGLTKQLINFVYSVLTPHVLGNPTKEDYNFGGWYAESDFSGEKIDILQYQNANITLYAKWTIDPVEVELSEGDTQALNAILTKPTIVVNGQFNKGQYIVNEKVYTYGIDCFVSIADAVAAASEGDIIYVFSGTYADDLTISANDLTLVGPNYNIHGNDTRYTEANITGLTTINGANVTINGLKFSGNGAIKVGADNVTISHIHMSAKQVACNGNNRQGCIVDSANISDLSVLNSKIDAPNNGTDYSTYTNQYMSFSNVTNLTISGNYITNSGATTTSGSGSYSGMRIYTVGGKLNITNNEFRWATIGYVMYLAGYNSCTEINIIENIFDGTTAVPDSATITFRGSTAPIVIQGNEFYNFNGSTITFTSAATSNVIVRYNYFDENTLYKIGTSGSTSISYENNYYEATSQTTSTPDYGKVESYEELKELYRIWKLPSHNVSLNLNGGTVGQNLTTYKETIGATLPTPTKEGYSFVGWYDNAEFSGNSYSHISSTANTDLTFYAKWNLVNYTISYELDGGETINPDSYTIESENITLNAPTKEGYTFLGWTYDGQIEPTLSVTILKGSTGNRTYFANWEVNKYTIKYYDYDGTLLGTEEVNYGATISERENPTKDGYTFVEWTPAVPNTMPLNGIEVTAVYGMESESWELVTDASQLTVGDKVVIVANEYDYVLSTTQNDNNRGQTPGTKNATTIILGADAQIITLEEGAVAGTFAFNVGNGYLYAASNSSNYLRTEASLSDNSSWEITISDGVATIVA
ncbi:MAG: InlB B-repeat-containing protein, partial [Acholeplasmatales bacterium]|nr:InlB B-repeat-containing protein [Acholeplasmatales bacterium]